MYLNVIVLKNTRNNCSNMYSLLDGWGGGGGGVVPFSMSNLFHIDIGFLIPLYAPIC